MNRRTLRFALGLVLVCLLASLAGAADAPKNVILMIGDGMGFEQVRAAGLYATGKAGGLAFEKHYRCEVMTSSLDSWQKSHATDSAAAGTALATGAKTNNGMLSQTPAGARLHTVLEVARAAGKRTGLVTTVPMTHATPAAFASHVKSRKESAAIAGCYFNETRPNVLFGAYLANGKGVTREKAEKAAYTVVTTREELAAFVAKARQGDGNVHVSGQFSPEQLAWEYSGPLPEPTKEEKAEAAVAAALAAAKKAAAKAMGVDEDDDDDDAPKAEPVSYDVAPRLSEMSEAALAILGRGPDGLFLMIEGGAIDWAGHKNIIERNIYETVEFAKAFEVVMKWAEGRTDTLIIVTADHETGGLGVLKTAAKGKFPRVAWISKNHTGLNVPLYAWGPGSEGFVGIVDNTDLFEVMSGRPKPAAQAWSLPKAAAAAAK
jgi:alkaline phosphatase